MKRYQLLGLALVAVFAFSAVLVSAAGAVEFLLAEFLNAGAKITTAQASDAEAAELELVSSNGGNLKVKTKVLCSGILDGTVGPGSEGVVKELLTLAGVAVSTTTLSGEGLSCTNDENCGTPKVWASGLPWKTELELMVDGTETFFVNLLINAGYYVECTVLGVKINETCTAAETAVQTTNETGGLVDQTFSDTFQVLAGLKLANCTLGGTETAEVNGLGTLLLTGGTALTASSE